MDEVSSEQPVFQNPQDILMNAPIGIFTTTPDGRYLSVNNTLARMHGYDSPRQLMDTVTDIATQIYVDPANRDELKRLLEKYGQVTNFESRLRHRNGTYFWVSENINEIKDEDGNTIGYQGFNQDITKRKQIEEELRRNETLLHIAGDLVRLGGWSVDLAKKRVIWSDQVANIHEMPDGYSPAVEDVISFYAPEYRDRIRQVFSDCAEHGVPYDEEMQIITGKGRRVWVRTIGVALRDESGSIVLAQGGIQDISGRKKIEQDLRAALEEKMVLLREVHHRVKNNLAIIAALLEMQQEEVKDPAAAAVLTDLDTRIRSIALVHERLYQKKNLARIDFQDYLESLLQDLRYSFAPGRDTLCTVLAQGISLEIDLAIPCGMIVNELVTNAFKYAFPDGKTCDGRSGPEIRVEARKEDGHYRIMVEDNGVGFPKEVDLNNSLSFGLRLVRMIGAHQLGGKFELERSSGTRVSFTFKPQKAQVT